MELTMAQAQQLGKEIAEFLNLKESDRKEGTFETAWGRKTQLGLGLSVQRMIKEIIECKIE